MGNTGSPKRAGSTREEMRTRIARSIEQYKQSFGADDTRGFLLAVTEKLDQGKPIADSDNQFNLPFRGQIPQAEGHPYDHPNILKPGEISPEEEPRQGQQRRQQDAQRQQRPRSQTQINEWLPLLGDDRSRPAAVAHFAVIPEVTFSPWFPTITSQPFDPAAFPYLPGDGLDSGGDSATLGSWISDDHHMGGIGGDDSGSFRQFNHWQDLEPGP
jgi:hypothetical protein